MTFFYFDKYKVSFVICLKLLHWFCQFFIEFVPKVSLGGSWISGSPPEHKNENYLSFSSFLSYRNFSMTSVVSTLNSL